MLRVLCIFLLAICAKAGPSLPVFFIANQGQAPRAVRYMAQGSGMEAYLERHEVRLRAQSAWVRVRFEGAAPNTRVEGSGPLAARANFLIGSVRQWHRDVPTYAAVVYRDLYPGIDMVYGAQGRRLKSEFVVAPGADPGLIRIRYSGAGRPAIEPDGSLTVPAGEQRLTEDAPNVYQERDGAAVPVQGRYTIAAGGTVGFALGAYDRALPLVIDPLVSFNTVIGGTSASFANSVAVDSAGAAYVAGYTDSATLPTVNAMQRSIKGSNNAFVAKMDPSGGALVYCTYVGGSNDDRAYGIAVDSAGAAYVTGTATSPDFPTFLAEQSSLRGARNAFVLKLNPSGNALEFSTFLGGNGSDQANGIALDASGNVYVTGDTTSMNFPASGFQTSYRGSQDAFVAKFSASGANLLFSTYLGGAGTDHGAAVAVDSGGTVYVTGSTWSADFPVANAFQGSNAGYCDAFVARLSPDGNKLLFSTYLGGSGGRAGYPEAGQALALDPAGNAYVVGVTSSGDFPLRNAIQPQLEGFIDAFVAKVDPSGALLFSTYMGGCGVDIANAVALDASGAVYVVGYTSSVDFPVTVGAVQTANGGGYDAFLFKLSPVGDVLLYATYLGGTGSDTASGIAVDAGGNVYLTGWTMSANFPAVRGGT